MRQLKLDLPNIDKNVAALRSLFGGKTRKQEILTPKAITDYVREAFGGTIMLDPCPSFQLEETVCAGHTSTDGLNCRWMDRTFVNPPFKTLRPWLEKACTYKEERIIVLAPVRTHRKWFREAMVVASSIMLLNPVTFVGYDQVFPAPLCLLFFNTYGPPSELGDFVWMLPTLLPASEPDCSAQLVSQF